MICDICKQDVTRVTFTTKDTLGRCRDCHGGPTTPLAPGIITDSIPGGYLVKNGICNEDGSPRRFDSKSEIKRAAFEAGYTISNETPKVNQRLKEARLAREGR